VVRNLLALPAVLLRWSTAKNAELLVLLHENVVVRRRRHGLLLLAFGVDPCLADPTGRTPMVMAVSYRHDLAIKLLQTHIERRNSSA
jgi:hypothetical protein